MKNTASLALTAFIATSTIAFAASDSWTNTTSGLWRIGTNWSGAVPPSTSFDPTTIANAGTKTITVDSATPAANLSIRTFGLSAPAGSTNTLFLSDLSSPFITGRPVTIGSGGILRITNSTMTVQDTFDITGGSLILDSGLLDTTPNLVDVRLGRASGAVGRATLNGGTLKCFGLRVGELSGSQGACTINGGALWCTSVLSMGELLNSPGSVTLLSGQIIATNDITRVGNLATGTFTQIGGSSQLSFLSIGDNASGTMNISNGTLVVTPNSDLDVTRVGNFGDSQFNISGGSIWLRGDFHVADNPGVKGTVLLSGGTLTATNGLVAIGRYGIGSMTITNATAFFTNASVGRHDGAVGTLEVQTAASLFCVDDLSIGRFSNAVGHVTISGGLLSLTNDNVWAGRDGAGDLTVGSGAVRAKNMFVGMSEFGTNAPQGLVTLNGGITSLSSNLLIGTDLISTGQVVVSGGALTVTNGAANGIITIVAGSFALNDGTVSANALAMTNGGTFSFSNGTLRLGRMAVANGSPFVVGDGVHPATLELQGGTFTFADGLVVSQNATVTGCGTIVGSVVTNGVVSLNCGSGPPPTTISSVGVSGNNASLSFPTVSGLSYTLEYKITLSDAAWIPILPGIVGNGGPGTLSDPAATNATRFYRIHIQ